MTTVTVGRSGIGREGYVKTQRNPGARTDARPFNTEENRWWNRKGVGGPL